jgi:hypothetical protein
MASSKTKLRKKPKRFPWIKLVAALLLIPLIAITAFLVRYYYIFDGTIELKLGKHSRLAETKIYAAPMVLYPGQSLSISELESRIRRLGYENSDTAVDSPHYQLQKHDRLMICNDKSAPQDPNRRVEVTFARNAIQSIKDGAN